MPIKALAQGHKRSLEGILEQEYTIQHASELDEEELCEFYASVFVRLNETLRDEGSSAKGSCPTIYFSVLTKLRVQIERSARSNIPVNLYSHILMNN